jgi:hypothetical protein
MSLETAAPSGFIVLSPACTLINVGHYLNDNRLEKQIIPRTLSQIHFIYYKLNVECPEGKYLKIYVVHSISKVF